MIGVWGSLPANFPISSTALSSERPLNRNLGDGWAAQRRKPGRWLSLGKGGVKMTASWNKGEGEMVHEKRGGGDFDGWPQLKEIGHLPTKD